MFHRTFVIGAALCLCGFRAEVQSTPQPAPGPQPGLAWTEEQLRKAAHHVRAGRTLTPKVWPNGARVAWAGAAHSCVSGPIGPKPSQ